MKRLILSLVFAFILISVCASLVGCSEHRYCDPRGKEWYNSPSLPNITNPFEEIYDGSYAIQIDKDGRVKLTTLTGEEVEGILTASYNGENWRSAKISIEFEDGETATGSCSEYADGRILSIYYKWKGYSFVDKKQISKEEFEEYREGFVEFLVDVYETGKFPTYEELEANSLYRQFVDCAQRYGSSKYEYETLEKVTVEKIKDVQYDEYSKNITLTVGAESKDYYIYADTNVAIIRNGKIEKLDFTDLKKGECLVILDENFSADQGRIKGMFYVEND